MNLSLTARFLIRSLDQAESKLQREETEVNPLVSELASWYEKLRNALEYQEEEVILRAAIGRILRRRIVLGKKNESVAEPLIRELIWARYFPENTIPQRLINEVEEKVNLYLRLRDFIYQKHKLAHSIVDDWINQLMSADVEQTLQKKPSKDLMIGFIFKIFQNKVVAESKNLEQTRDVQLYIAIRRVFAKEDLAMLRFSLFQQLYGELNEKNVEEVAIKFIDGYNEINTQLSHPLKDKIYSYIKRYIPPFFVLAHLFEENRGSIGELLANESDFEGAVLKGCEAKYREVSKKIGTAVFRSIIFILITKALFAVFVETTLENMLYGSVSFMALGFNVFSAPIIMFITTLLISPPKKSNSFKILEFIKNILSEENPSKVHDFSFSLKKNETRTSFVLIYGLLWLFALGLGIFGLNILLNLVHFTFISKVVFFFFLMIVSFMCYRISQIPRQYIMSEERQGIRSLLFDFFFIPFIQVGKALTLGIAQVNIFLFIFDYLIEAPFKEIFSFIEQWFFFLRSQRESID